MSSHNKNEELTSDGLRQLDTLLQHRSRLGVCVLLSNTTALSFSRLKQLLQETDGNLGAQLRKLEEADYIAVRKEFQERKPVSWYSLTPVGREQLAKHLTGLADLMRLANGENK